MEKGRKARDFFPSNEVDILLPFGTRYDLEPKRNKIGRKSILADASAAMQAAGYSWTCAQIRKWVNNNVSSVRRGDRRPPPAKRSKQQSPATDTALAPDQDDDDYSCWASDESAPFYPF
jgi:hypothetical protein